jgi:CHASE2 domain-containing sensor protein
VDPIFTFLIIFLVTGFVSMSAALSAGAINKRPAEEKTGKLAERNAQVAIIMAGNLAALTLIGAMAFGMLNLEWWIPLVCMFVSFPVVHLLVMQRLLGDVKNLILMTPLVIGSIATLYYYW